MPTLVNICLKNFLNDAISLNSNSVSSGLTEDGESCSPSIYNPIFTVFYYLLILPQWQLCKTVTFD